MSDSEINQLLMERFVKAQTLRGRVSMNACTRWKQWSWRIVVSGTLWFKRAFDIVASSLFLIAFSPIYAIVALLIKLEDGGPVFFAQKRVGKHGREFRMFKFRSMCIDAEARLKEVLARNQHQEGITFKIKDDPRITRVGKWIRKTSVDEFPQFYNVFIGDMSLVGPRPPVPREVALYTAADRRRLAVTPGITCLWQIGGRAEIDFPGQVQLDVQYIESQSFWGDVKILLKTIPAVLCSKGAY
jgi:exopolysaccharide biosynthesis polyprenyl glycosylphosphotransferase